jgi:hypothetical protein
VGLEPTPYGVRTRRSAARATGASVDCGLTGNCPTRNRYCLREDSNPHPMGKSQERCPLRHGGVSFRGPAFHLRLLSIQQPFGGATGTCTRNTTVRRSRDPVSPSPHVPFCPGAAGRSRTRSASLRERLVPRTPRRPPVARSRTTDPDASPWSGRRESDPRLEPGTLALCP